MKRSNSFLLITSLLVICGSTVLALIVKPAEGQIVLPTPLPGAGSTSIAFRNTREAQLLTVIPTIVQATLDAQSQQSTATAQFATSVAGTITAAAPTPTDTPTPAPTVVTNTVKETVEVTSVPTPIVPTPTPAPIVGVVQSDAFAISGWLIGMLGLLAAVVQYAGQRKTDDFVNEIKRDEERRKEEELERQRNAAIVAEQLLRHAEGIPAALAAFIETEDKSQYRTRRFWKSLADQPKITAVVSSKGGVGKSSISLGLMEHYCQDGDVLLVDFDLHNRGLSSKFLGKMQDQELANEDQESREQNSSGYSTVLDELKRFNGKQSDKDREILPRLREKLRRVKAERIGQSESESPSAFDLVDITRKVFVDFFNDFIFKNRDENEYFELQFYELDHDRPSVERVDPKKCWFLPSRRRFEPFIATPESRLDIPELALFLKYLAGFAKRIYNVKRVILDCHGAHDLFMVAAIVAADHLVVVTRAELGSFEGTLELLTFADELAKDQSEYFTEPEEREDEPLQDSHGKEQINDAEEQRIDLVSDLKPLTQVLVVNEYRKDDDKIIKAILKSTRETSLRPRFEDLVRIEASEWLYDLYRNYYVTSICRKSYLWNIIRGLAEGNMSSVQDEQLTSEQELAPSLPVSSIATQAVSRPIENQLPESADDPQSAQSSESVQQKQGQPRTEDDPNYPDERSASSDS